MSRIDDALKRTAPERLSNQPGGVATDLPAQVADASSLDRYAVERPASAPDNRQSAPSRLIAAPHVSRVPRTSVHKLPAASKLVGNPGVAPATADQFRRLGAVLHDTQLQTGLKTLLVSSAVPGEGKTLTVVNLALTLSESFHRRVLLVDADLRRPTIHDLLGCSNEAGLGDVLRTGSQSLPLVQISSCLSVLTAGRPTANPLAQLTSDRMHDVIRHAVEDFDWVLLDTPPVGLLPDAQLVARMCEGVVFVIAAGSTPYSLVQHSIAQLPADRIVGTVLNRVEPRSLRAANYYAGYY